ncbi:MAG: hypothetical protein CSB06_03365 [Bacteroidia bacterium]|nr:MAG: hypothetical protein CSB06_03365 [Bacteroidia bacterium]
MRDFFKLNNNNWQELMFDMQALRRAFYNNEDSCRTSFKEMKGFPDVCKSIDYEHKMKRKGEIYISQSRTKFAQNIIADTDGGIENISLHFINQAQGAFSINKRSKREMPMPAHSGNIFFMHEDFGEYALYKKDSVYETKGLLLPVPYFERLVNLYPDLLGDAFRRYQNGESFYLNDHFLRTNFEISNVLQQLENSNLMGNWHNAYVDSKVLELLSLMFVQEQCPMNEPCGKCCKTCTDRDKIREAAYIIESNIDNPLTIRQLALRVGVNEKKLKCGFKEVFNKTVYGYLFEYRMKIAERLLRDTQLPINEIARQLGFEYPSHFSTAFKRYFGFSPKDRCKL